MTILGSIVNVVGRRKEGRGKGNDQLMSTRIFILKVNKMSI